MAVAGLFDDVSFVNCWSDYGTVNLLYGASSPNGTVSSH